jgi:flagellar capping protein FliD
MRYVQQFAAMEAFVEKTQGVGDYLKGQFEAMRNSNN